MTSQFKPAASKKEPLCGFPYDATCDTASAENLSGTLERKRTSYCLGEVTTRGVRPPADIEKAAEDYTQTINNSVIPAEHNVNLSDFVESVYLPWIKQNRRPSTYKNCRDVWNDHLQPVSSRDSDKSPRDSHVYCAKMAEPNRKGGSQPKFAEAYQVDD